MIQLCLCRNNLDPVPAQERSSDELESTQDGDAAREERDSVLLASAGREAIMATSGPALELGRSAVAPQQQ